MKILLISSDTAVESIIGLCLDKPGFELLNDESKVDECDLVVKDVDEKEELNLENFNQSKTLFLVTSSNHINLKYKLVKPFLPTDFINFLTSYENILKQEEEDILKSVKDDKSENIQNITNIIDELDSMDKEQSLESVADEIATTNLMLDDTKEKEPSQKLEGSTIQELSDSLDIKMKKDDDLPLQDIANELNKPLEKEQKAQNEIFGDLDEIKIEPLDTTDTQEEKKDRQSDKVDSFFDKKDEEENKKEREDIADEEDEEELDVDENSKNRDELCLDDLEERLKNSITKSIKKSLKKENLNAIEIKIKVKFKEK